MRLAICYLQFALFKALLPSTISVHSFSFILCSPRCPVESSTNSYPYSNPNPCAVLSKVFNRPLTWFDWSLETDWLQVVDLLPFYSIGLRSALLFEIRKRELYCIFYNPAVLYNDRAGAEARSIKAAMTFPLN